MANASSLMGGVMKRVAILTALALAAAPALAQSVPFRHLLESGMNVAAEKAGWKWIDAKQGFNVAGAGNGFGLTVDVEAGKTYFLAAACAKPCTKVGMRLLTADQQPVGAIVWGAASGDIHVATHTYTAPATAKLILVAAIGECPEPTCPGAASAYLTRAN
jgi:hypothetical protein